MAPRLLLRILGLTNADTRGLIEMLHQFEQPFLFDDSKYREAFGGEATPMDAAVESTVAWFQAHAGD